MSQEQSTTAAKGCNGGHYGSILEIAGQLRFSFALPSDANRLLTPCSGRASSTARVKEFFPELSFNENGIGIFHLIGLHSQGA